MPNVQKLSQMLSFRAWLAIQITGSNQNCLPAGIVWDFFPVSECFRIQLEKEADAKPAND